MYIYICIQLYTYIYIHIYICIKTTASPVPPPLVPPPLQTRLLRRAIHLFGALIDHLHGLLQGALHRGQGHGHLQVLASVRSSDEASHRSSGSPRTGVVFFLSMYIYIYTYILLICTKSGVKTTGLRLLP